VSAHHLRFQFVRVGGLGGHRYVSVKLRIEPLDTLEAGFRQLDWRDGALPQSSGNSVRVTMLFNYFEELKRKIP
jgi:hypothetical protein